MAGAALVYVAIRDVSADTLETWWNVHACAYEVFLGVLYGSFGLRLKLGKEDQKRLYDAATEMIERVGSKDDLTDLEVSEPMLLLMKEFCHFLEK